MLAGAGGLREPCCLKPQHGPWESPGSYSGIPLPTLPGEGGWNLCRRQIELLAAASVNPVMLRFQRNISQLFLLKRRWVPGLECIFANQMLILK